MRYYVDDGILVELQWWPDGRRCLRAVQSLASDHFRLLGERGVSDPPLLSTSKITDWDTRLELLGWIIDRGVDGYVTVTQTPQVAFAPRRVAPVSCICVCEAGVQARGFSHAYLVRGASGIVFRATFAGFGWYAARCLRGWLRVPHA